MKTIEIVGKNYFGHWTHERTACRGVIIEDGRVLLSYAARDDLWMIPGGGLEAGEDEGSAASGSWRRRRVASSCRRPVRWS